MPRYSSFAKRLPARCSFIFLKQEKVRRCQVRTLRRMLVDVSMELLKQQGLFLPSSMRTYIVVQQNNSTRERASSARSPKISSACRKRKTPRTSESARFSIGTAIARELSALTTWEGPMCNCIRQFSISNWTPETNDRLQQNRCADCMRTRSLLFVWPS